MPKFFKNGKVAGSVPPPSHEESVRLSEESARREVVPATPPPAGPVEVGASDEGETNESKRRAKK